jgi:hypothetical protein
MTAIAEEIRTEYRYTNKSGATVVIRNVPARYSEDESGEVHKIYSLAVAMRCEELSNRAFEIDSSDGAIHELEF